MVMTSAESQIQIGQCHMQNAWQWTTGQIQNIMLLPRQINCGQTKTVQQHFRLQAFASLCLNCPRNFLSPCLIFASYVFLRILSIGKAWKIRSFRLSERLLHNDVAQHLRLKCLLLDSAIFSTLALRSRFHATSGNGLNLCINIVFNLALSYYYLQLLNCLLYHQATDPFGLQIGINFQHFFTPQYLLTC